MILITTLAVFAVGVLGGAAIMKINLTHLTPTALQRANHRDAIALARDLVKTPDALDLRPRAQRIIAAYEAATGTTDPRE
jgi:hypothetical protein